MSLETSIDYGGAIVVAVRGAVEHFGAGRLSTTIDDVVRRYHPSVLYVDLGLVTYLDAGCGALLGECRRRAAISGTTLLFRHASPPARHVLEVSGLSDHLR